MVAKVSSNDLLISIFCVGVEQFWFHFFYSTTRLKKIKETNCSKKDHTVCALPKTKDHFKSTLPLNIIWKLWVSHFFRWFTKVARNEKFSYLKWPKKFYQCRIQEWSYWYRSIVSKALDIFKFQSFNNHSLAFSIQIPVSRVQRLASRLLPPESRNSGIPSEAKF